MSRCVLNLLGHEGYFALPTGWIRYEPDPRTGCMPGELKYSRWRIQPPPQAGWDVQAERQIVEMESSQQRGDLDRVTEGLASLEALTARLESHIERCRRLAERARAVAARHEPSAGRRSGT